MANPTPGEVKKQLNGITLLCLAFVICNSWAGIAGSLQLALLAGGPATLIYSILVTTTAYLVIAASMAELAAVYPTAGGQYHFASILAPERWRRGLSYTCGLLALFSWLVIGVSVTSIAAQQLLALVSTSLLDFVPQSWHIFLVYQGFALFAMLYNAFVLKKNPWTHTLAFILTIALFLTCFVLLLVRGNPRESHEFVWNTFLNYTGWPDGVCFLVGLSTSCYMYNGLDGAMHMAEESSNAERVVPRTMLGAVGIGFTTGFAYTVAQVYAISDIQEIMTTTQWIPFVVMEQGFRSRTIAIVIVSISVVLGMTIIIATQEASSRLAWSLARDKGLLFSRFLQDLYPRLDVPLWSLLLVWLLTFLCGFLYLASKTAFNAIVGSSVILQQLSFVIPIILVIARKRSKIYLSPGRSFRLPDPLGWIANVYAVAFITLMTVILCLPVTIPTGASTMNYTCVILGFCLLLGLANWWLHAKKQYNGPLMEQCEGCEAEQPVSSPSLLRQRIGMK
ncbi:amino acid permease family protein [Aspergillus arachidicola]|uniref:Amino acid permease family protein n=1 Tax=Aspergillus arachidicola TaxID=656916 RepID=A0A2G7G6E6_9EURO|nr:amino acid permease family protein [Aspergillus arachidicola]